MRLIVMLVVGIIAIGVVWIYFVPQVLCFANDGEWSYRTRICDLGEINLPEVEMENEEEVETPNEEVDLTSEYKDLIRVTTPKPGTTIASPITITGEARGMWYFEASFPVTIVDWDGRIIGEGHAEAQSDWMTEEYVPFTATVTYILPPETPYKRGWIILAKDNPSGLPEHDDAFEFPIEFK